jgi:hypothetical protein
VTDPRYTFLGHDVPLDVAHRLADRLVLRDERDGTHVVRARTAHLVALRCTCGHHERHHGTDRRGRALCFGASTCGCATYQPETRTTP